MTKRLHHWTSNLEPSVRKARELWRKSRRYVTVASNVLRDLYYVRDGSRLAKVTAAASIAGHVADAVYPELSIEEELVLQGYHPVATPLAGFLCELVERRGHPARTFERGSDQTVKVWEDGIRGVAAVYRGGEYESGPYILADDDSLLVDTSVGELWGQGTDLMLECAPSSKKERSRYRSYAICSIPDPGPFIGEPGPDYWAKRVAAYGGRPRTMLIKGPSGVGKSVLARHVGRLAAGGAARTLKVTGEVVRDFGASELRDIARFLQPTVLLLDDLDVEKSNQYGDGSGNMLDALLGTFESLRVDGCLVIVTKMETVRVDSPRRGEHYIEGMRPGRVDELVLLPVPDDKTRDAILRHYYQECSVDPLPSDRAHKAIVKMTAGLTGAYLKEVAERLSVHGAGSAKDEIVNILLTAPDPPRKKRKGSAITFVRKRRTGKMSERARRRAQNGLKQAAKFRKRADRLERGASADMELAKKYEAHEKKRVKEAAAKKPRKQKRKKPLAVAKSDALAEGLEKLLEVDSSDAKPTAYARPRRRRR